MKSLAEWLAYIEQQHPNAIELGLERLLRVKASLEQGQRCPLITVAGTNGKGSTCAMLEAILLAAGYRVGLYTSPHLIDYNERVRIGGQPVSDEALCAAFAKVDAARGDIPLTYFEYGTLAAWEVFNSPELSTSPLDVIILEVGLGGRLDAVNIYDADCAIVTGIDIDHVEFLGNTREAIGFEKAGIFRKGHAAVCGDPMPPASLLKHAAELGVPLQLIGRDFGYQQHADVPQQWSYWAGTEIKRGGLAHPALRGKRQLSNASVVFAALESLRAQLPVAMSEIRQGLAVVELPGRFQVLPGRPVIILDVAHNPQAAQVLADNLLDQGFYARTWAICGMLRDKDIASVIEALKGRVDAWLPCSLHGPRAATADELSHYLQAGGQAVTAQFEDPLAAYAYARANAGESDRILVFGSFLTVADVLREIRKQS